jgi:hypothetical protein
MTEVVRASEMQERVVRRILAMRCRSDDDGAGAS